MREKQITRSFRLNNRAGMPVIAALMFAASAGSLMAQGGVQFYPDGVIRDIENDVAMIELPKWPLPVDKGTKVGFFEIVNVFTAPGQNRAIVAEIDVRNIARVFDADAEIARINLSDAGGRGKIKVQAGKPVLINNELRYGRQYVVRDDSRSAKLVFEEDFGEDTKIGIYWESIPGALSIENGRLVVDRWRKELQKVQSPNEGTMMIKLNVMGYGSKYQFKQEELTQGNVCFEFDLETTSGMKVSFDTGGYGKALTGLDFVVGRYDEQESGIYLKDVQMNKLAGGTGKRHVILTVTPKMAELMIDGRACRAGLAGVKATGYRNLVLFCKGKFIIDNFRIWKLPGDLMEGVAKVVGFDTAKEKVLVYKGGGAEWDSSLPGRAIIFGGSDSNSPSGLIVADVKDYVVCEAEKSVIEKLGSGTAASVGKFVKAIPAPAASNAVPDEVDVSATAKAGKEEDEKGDTHAAVLPFAAVAVNTLYEEMVQSTNEVFQLAPLAQGGERKWDFTICKVQQESGNKLVLKPPHEDLKQLPGAGYIYPVLQTVAQPVSGNVLGAKVGKPAKCEFKKEGADIVAVLGEGEDAKPQPGTKFFIMGGQLLRFPWTNGYFELSGLEHSSDRMGNQQFWRIVSGNWANKGSRLLSSSPLDKEGVPVIVSSREMDGNFRFDFDVVVEKPVKQIFCTYTKDISCMFYSVAQHKGITFGFGAEGYGGVSTDMGSPGAVNLNVRDDAATKGGKAQKEDDTNRIRMTAPARDKDKPREKPREKDKPKEEEHRVRWEGHKTYLGIPLEAKLGKIYRMRFQRIGDEYAMYINGRRIHSEKLPSVSGRVQGWIMCPESVLSVDRATIMRLPRTSMPVSQSSPLGEFGYVVAVEGTEAIIDSDVQGLEKGSRVTIVTTEKEVRSTSDSKRLLSVELKCVAVGTVVEEGRRLSRVNLGQPADEVKVGMKVLKRRCSGTFSLSRTDVADIEQEL
ncbi:MAG: hypothetical protein C0404_01155 [Verrucomicrobia bacterium]|nr:hypothetical protein [Verrucomicrobiota bacterium]